jgi:hypothetical protein
LETGFEHEAGFLGDEFAELGFFDFGLLAFDFEEELGAAVALAGALDDLLAAFVAPDLAQVAGEKRFFLSDEGEDVGALGDDGEVAGFILGLHESRFQVLALVFELFQVVVVAVVGAGECHSKLSMVETARKAKLALFNATTQRREDAKMKFG